MTDKDIYLKYLFNALNKKYKQNIINKYIYIYFLEIHNQIFLN